MANHPTRQRALNRLALFPLTCLLLRIVWSPLYKPFFWEFKACIIVVFSTCISYISVSLFAGNLDSFAYQCLLKNELLGAGIDDLKHHQSDLEPTRKVLAPKESNSLFKYRVHAKNLKDDSSPYSLSPVGENSQKLLRSPRKVCHTISSVVVVVLTTFCFMAMWSLYMACMETATRWPSLDFSPAWATIVT